MSYAYAYIVGTNDLCSRHSLKGKTTLESFERIISIKDAIAKEIDAGRSDAKSVDFTKHILSTHQQEKLNAAIQYVHGFQSPTLKDLFSSTKPTALQKKIQLELDAGIMDFEGKQKVIFKNDINFQTLAGTQTAIAAALVTVSAMYDSMENDMLKLYNSRNNDVGASGDENKMEATKVGSPSYFAAVRPPGHHARNIYELKGNVTYAIRPRPAGFCYMNNILIAAIYAMLSSPQVPTHVCIVDIDFHYGGGVQEILQKNTRLLEFLQEKFHKITYISLQKNRDLGEYDAPMAFGKGKKRDSWSNPQVEIHRVYAQKPSSLYKAMGQIQKFVKNSRSAWGQHLGNIFSQSRDRVFVSAGFDGHMKKSFKKSTKVGFSTKQYKGIGAFLRCKLTPKFPIFSVLEGGFIAHSMGNNIGKSVAAFLEGTAALLSPSNTEIDTILYKYLHDKEPETKHHIHSIAEKEEILRRSGDIPEKYIKENAKLAGTFAARMRNERDLLFDKSKSVFSPPLEKKRRPKGPVPTERATRTLSKTTFVAKSLIRGGKKGLFAAKDIADGACVDFFVGVKLNDDLTKNLRSDAYALDHPLDEHFHVQPLIQQEEEEGEHQSLGEILSKEKKFRACLKKKLEHILEKKKEEQLRSYDVDTKSMMGHIINEPVIDASLLDYSIAQTIYVKSGDVLTGRSALDGVMLFPNVTFDTDLTVDIEHTNVQGNSVTVTVIPLVALRKIYAHEELYLCYGREYERTGYKSHCTLADAVYSLDGKGGCLLEKEPQEVDLEVFNVHLRPIRVSDGTNGAAGGGMKRSQPYSTSDTRMAPPKNVLATSSSPSSSSSPPSSSSPDYDKIPLFFWPASKRSQFTRMEIASGSFISDVKKKKKSDQEKKNLAIYNSEMKILEQNILSTKEKIENFERSAFQMSSDMTQKTKKLREYLQRLRDSRSLSEVKTLKKKIERNKHQFNITKKKMEQILIEKSSLNETLSKLEKQQTKLAEKIKD